MNKNRLLMNQPNTRGYIFKTCFTPNTDVLYMSLHDVTDKIKEICLEIPTSITAVSSRSTTTKLGPWTSTAKRLFTRI